jgi:hypothetical protein
VSATVCDGQIEVITRDLPPVNGWRNWEDTGNRTFACQHGLDIAGPRDDVAEQVKAHWREVIPADQWPSWI